MSVFVTLLATAICGFEVKSVEPLPEVSAKLWRMEYQKNGAELVWLDCDDENRAFAIAFCTLPEDDTGIAHIIEHSVLCGSEKYPCREPFVELLKSSPNTYLNASTSRDWTVYPFASRNEKDFLNLMNVYLDAVFHPLSVRDDHAMRQEGWHYEYDGTNLVRNGVVYSEMKGAMASSGTVAYNEAMKLVFPDNAYGRISGGDPEHIPELTFEKYRAFHAKFYHPTNARIYLYGRIDLEKCLKPIADALAGFERREGGLYCTPLQAPTNGCRTVRYASAEEQNRTIVTDAWVYGGYENRDELLALELLGELLTGSNFSPLKEPFLKAGLCEDVSLGVLAKRQTMVMLRLQNVKDGQTDACRRLVRETLERLVREGFDRERIAQLIDKREFAWLERDSSRRGLDIFYELTDSWLYGGDPAAVLKARDTFAKLRRLNGTGWYEQLLRKAVLENVHHGEVTLVPSATLAAERKAAEDAELARLKNAMTPAELAAIAAEAAELKRWQSEPENPANLAKLPRLELADIPERVELPEGKVSVEDGVTVIRPEITTDGYFYLDLCFSLAGFSEAELLDMPLIAELLGELGSKKRTAAALRGDLDGKLGIFETSVGSYERGPQLIVRLGALDAHLEDALSLAKEVLLETDFGDLAEIGKARKQNRSWLERSIQGRGACETAVTRVEGAMDARGRIEELFSGMTQLRHLQRGKAGDLVALARRVFTRDRLTVVYAGKVPEDFVARVSGIWPRTAEGKDGEIGETVLTMPVRPVSEGFEIDGAIAHAVTSAHLPEGVAYSGSQLVAARIIALEYLWPEVRMKGGAYGSSLAVRPNGNVIFNSYRDPNPARSYAVFEKAADGLEAFVKSGRPFTNFQISTVERTNPNLSNRGKMSFIRSLYFNGRDLAMLRRLRHEILTTSADDLLNFARTLKELSKDPNRCAVGGGTLLDGCAFRTREKVL